MRSDTFTGHLVAALARRDGTPSAAVPRHGVRSRSLLDVLVAGLARTGTPVFQPAAIPANPAGSGPVVPNENGQGRRRSPRPLAGGLITVWALVGGCLALFVGADLREMLEVTLHEALNTASSEPENSDGLDSGVLLVVVGLVAAGMAATIALTVSARIPGSAAPGHPSSRTPQDAPFAVERFDRAQEQLRAPDLPTRLAGIRAMAGLADESNEPGARQACIDALCSAARGASGHLVDDAELDAARMVRVTVLRTIASHLRRDGASESWSGRSFDLSGLTADVDLDFSGMVFDVGWLSFRKANVSGRLTFRGADLVGGRIGFQDATFTGGAVSFDDARFAGTVVDFEGARFRNSGVSFAGAAFEGGAVAFSAAEFQESTIDLHDTGFAGGSLDLSTVAELSEPPRGVPPAAPGLHLPDR